MRIYRMNMPLLRDLNDSLKQELDILTKWIGENDSKLRRKESVIFCVPGSLLSTVPLLIISPTTQSRIIILL